MYEGFDDVSVGLGPRDTLVALVVDPAECLSCDGRIVFMLAARRQFPRSIRLVLSRAPTEGERRQLVLYRIPIDGRMVPGGKWKDSIAAPPFGIAVIPPEGLRTVPLDSLQSLVRSLFVH